MRDIEYINCKNGSQSVVIDGYLIHSKYDPIKEAKLIVKKEMMQGYLHILFGYGVGYIAEALKELIDSNFIIYEPCHEIINNNSDKKFISDILVLEKEIESRLKNYETKIKVICTSNYNKIYPEEYKQLLKTVNDIQYEHIVNENTVRFFSETWQENYIRNISCLNKSKSLIELENKYSCPVVVASGGPSLTKQLELLNEIKDSVIIVAAGSTINSLLAQNIEPDYVVSIDGGMANFNHFKNIKANKTKLIYALSSNYKIQENYNGELFTFIYSDEGDLKKRLIDELQLDLPLMYTGGSVANSALHIASFITTGPIALIGQDLAYTNNQSHASNNVYERNIDSEYLKSKKAFEIEGYYGDKVYTDYSFFSMKKSFEKIYQLLKNNHEIYNCTEGGIKIEGIPQMPFDEFCRKNVNSNIIKKVTISGNEIDSSKMINFFKSEIDNYEKLKKNLKEAQSTLLTVKSQKVFSKGLLKKLDKVDESIKKIYPNVLMDRIVDPIMMDVMRIYNEGINETSAESFNRVYNQNVELYSRLLDAVRKSKQITEEVKLRLIIEENCKL